MSKRKKQKLRKSSPSAEEEETVRVVAKPKTTARTSTRASGTASSPLIFGQQTYLWLGGGFLLIVLGFLLMTGGRGDDPTVFDESVIYSWRKITLAPIIIISGLCVVTYAIFKK